MTSRTRLPTPRAILDGHIVLSRRLAEAGHYPAIDIEASISRAMTALITEKHYARVRNFKQLLSSFQRNRDLVSVGAYAKGSDPMLDKAITCGRSWRHFCNKAFLNAPTGKIQFRLWS
jgi:flagellar biosynthesis/type III secretory pathway ATPase